MYFVRTYAQYSALQPRPFPPYYFPFHSWYHALLAAVPGASSGDYALDVPCILSPVTS